MAVKEFHVAYYDSYEWRRTRWIGHEVLKCPFDLWQYQQLIVDLRPTLIVETGTFAGGSALFMASICEILGHGHVVTIDVAPLAQPQHTRLTCLTGSSIAPEIVAKISSMAKDCGGPVLVILDSDHTMPHVIREMQTYGPFVTVGSYMIVEDTNINGHPVAKGFGPGPKEAVDTFLPHHPEFVRDSSREGMLTFNPGGFLKRIR